MRGIGAEEIIEDDSERVAVVVVVCVILKVSWRRVK